MPDDRAHQQAVVAAVWVLTVVAAHALARRGLRGPAEVALRRLVYRPSRRSAADGTG